MINFRNVLQFTENAFPISVILLPSTSRLLPGSELFQPDFRTDRKLCARKQTIPRSCLIAGELILPRVFQSVNNSMGESISRSIMIERVDLFLDLHIEDRRTVCDLCSHVKTVLELLHHARELFVTVCARVEAGVELVKRASH